MTRISMAELKTDLSDVINRAAFGKERVVVTRRGKGLVAVVPVADLAALQTLEDQRDLEEAARALGVRHLRLAFRHVMPNTLGPFIVLMTAQLGSAVLVEAALSFLGLGVPEPYPSWGRMLSVSAAEYAQRAPWLVLFPGIAISLAVFGSNLLGDALRDTLDPRLRGA